MIDLLGSIARHAVLAALFVIILSIVVTLLIKSERLFYKDTKTIGLEALTSDKREQAKKDFQGLPRVVRSSEFDLDYSKHDDKIRQVQSFHENYPEFCTAVKAHLLKTVSLRKNYARFVTVIVLTTVVGSLFFLGAVDQKVLEKNSFFNPSVAAAAQNSSEQVEAQIVKVKELTGIIERGSSSVDSVKLATNQLPSELSKLNELLSGQTDANRALLEETNAQRLELETLRQSQASMQKLSKEEFSALRYTIFAEARENSDRVFWLGVAFTIIIQFFMLLAQEPLLNFLRKSRLGRKLYSPANVHFDGGQF